MSKRVRRAGLRCPLAKWREQWCVWSVLGAGPGIGCTITMAMLKRQISDCADIRSATGFSRAGRCSRTHMQLSRAAHSLQALNQLEAVKQRRVLDLDVLGGDRWKGRAGGSGIQQRAFEAIARLPRSLMVVRCGRRECGLPRRLGFVRFMEDGHNSDRFLVTATWKLARASPSRRSGETRGRRHGVGLLGLRRRQEGGDLDQVLAGATGSLCAIKWCAGSTGSVTVQAGDSLWALDLAVWGRCVD